MSTKDLPDPAGPYRKRRIGMIAVSIAVGILAMIAAAPKLLSTGPGQRVLLGMVNDEIAGSLSLESLTLNWFGGQALQGLALHDPEGMPVVTLDALTTELTLAKAALGKLNLGETRLQSLEIGLRVDDAGNDNLSAVLGGGDIGESAPDGGGLVIPVTGTVIIDSGHVTLSAPDIPPATLDGINARAQLDPEARALRFELAARSQLDGLEGRIDVTGQADRWLDATGELTPESAELAMQATVEDFPVAAADRLLGLDGRLNAALGERLAASLSVTGGDLDLRVDAPLLKLGLAGNLSDERLALREPASLRWQLTPALVTALAGDQALELAETVPVSMTVERLTLPVAAFDPRVVSVGARLQVGADVRLSGAGDLGNVTVRNVGVEIDSGSLAESLRLAGRAEVRDDRDTGKAEFDATIRSLFDGQGRLQLDSAAVDANANLAAIPTALLDRIGGTSGLLAATLGPQLNLAAGVGSGDGAEMDVTVEAHSANLDVPALRLTIEDDIRLPEPAQIRYRLTPDAFRHLAEDAEASLQRAVPLTVTLQAFSAPRPAAGEPLVQPAQTVVRAALDGDVAEVRSAGSSTRLDTIRLALTADPLSRISIDGGMNIAQTGDGLLAAFDASPAALRLTGESGTSADGTLTETRLRVSVEGGALQVAVPLKIAPGFESLALDESMRLKLPVTPELVAAWVPEEDGRLTRNATVEARLDRLRVPLAPFTMAGVTAKGSASATTLMFSTASGATGSVEDLKIDYRIDGAQGQGTVNVDGSLPSGAGATAGALKVRAGIAGLNTAGPATVTADVSVDELPQALLALAGADPVLEALPGSAIDLDVNLNVTLAETPEGKVAMKLASRNLNGAATFVLADTLTTAEPASFRLNLTPSVYEALTAGAAEDESESEASGGLTLAEEAALTLTLENLTWPLSEETSAPRGAAVEVEVPRLQLTDTGTGEQFLLESVRGSLTADDLEAGMKVALSAAAREGQGNPGRLSLNAELADAFDADGGVDIERMTLAVNGTLERLPVSILDRYLDMDGLALATFGTHVGANVKTRLREGRGPMTVTLKGDNAQAELDAQWQTGTLSLRRPVTAEVSATPEFGALVLSRIHPIFQSLQGGEAPILLEVPVEGVTIPIRDYALARLTVPEMRLGLGTLTLESGPLLRALMALAASTGNALGGDRWVAEFTPAMMQLADGRLSYQRRMDLLLGDRMHLATWGDVDLVNERTDLVLALMPHTLRSVFGIAAEESDVVRLPVQGGFDGSGVSFSKITTELARLEGQRQIRRRNLLLGAVAGAINARRSGAAADIPDPSLVPLPFADRLTTGAAETPDDDQTPQAESESEDGAKDLLDLFRRREN